MKELILLLKADVDIQSAFERYEEYQEGRGEIFLRQLNGALTLLRQHPEIGFVYQSPYRRLLLHDFPYGIFYTVEPARLIVVAVMDLRQNPETIRRRLT